MLKEKHSFLFVLQILKSYLLQITLILFFSYLPIVSFAQTGNIEIIRDARVDTLMKRYTQVQRDKGSIEGYRIQIAASANRTNVYQTKSQFYNLFPDIKSFVVYQAPNFKLRVGNYRTRLEAFNDLQKILPKFNGSFIIRDEIKIAEL